MNIFVIGGGAAGFFAAISAAQHHPESKVTLLEKSTKLLAKVKVSGGGRCNVTHACFDRKALLKNYPRGQKVLRQALAQWMPQNTVEWFENKGVPLKTETDGRMFPTSDDSQSIIDCLMLVAQKLKVEIHTQAEVTELKANNDGTFLLHIKNKVPEKADRVIVTTGGSPKLTGLNWLGSLNLDLVPPVPSLFTFNLPKEEITQLPGIAVPKVQVKIPGTKLQEEGSLLVTHWGISAFAVLRLSAWGARILHDLQYQCPVIVNWLPEINEEALRNQIVAYQQTYKARQVQNKNPFGLPHRLWEFLLNRWQVPAQKKWSELSKKERNRLVNGLSNDTYQTHGKTTFKEEFVTCGGVSLDEIEAKTMGCKKYPGLYFAGEVLDIDGLTGGFNFQAAWATGFVAGKLG
ncbi:NAD(P)/FAD-dependent oxidoreductase [uncultured Microscilla sp.]|uniref:NAD(P)/FAD-dependent oxidoreductase n=1 Tax=uncultured Microscilla sp. TaxID=432653 RepID=UPI002616C43B|nr:NAD(P)/FAD-dependent oxidoreductase [uncultured Microscilla sp.]